MTYSSPSDKQNLESLADTYKKLNEGEAAASVSRAERGKKDKSPGPTYTNNLAGAREDSRPN